MKESMAMVPQLDLEVTSKSLDGDNSGNEPAPANLREWQYTLGRVLVFGAAVVVPVMNMFSLTIIFQVMSLVISAVLFCTIPPLVYLALVRADRRHGGVRGGTWTIFKIYLGACAFLLLFGIVAIFRVYYETAESQDLAWFGAPSNSSVAFTIYSHDSEEAFIEWNDLTASGATETSVTQALSNSDKLGSIKLEGLVAGHKFEYAVKLVDANGNVRAGPSGEFKTMPNDATDKIIFTSSSCSQRGQRAVPVPLEAYSRIAEESDPDFMLFLGDFIYADIPLGFGFNGALGFGTDDKLYKSDYRATLGDPHLKKFMETTGFLTMYDDHEITNDYFGGNETALFTTALEAWESYAGSNNPASRADNQDGGSQYSYELGTHDMFVLDTRVNRDQDAGVIIGQQQLDQVKQWLLRTNTERSGFKFLASPSPFTANHFADDGAWNCGCPKCEQDPVDPSTCPRERDALLDFIELNNIKNVVLISGDSHKPGVYELREGIVEFSASPIHAWAQDLFTKTEDKTLYQKNEITMSWAMYTLENDTLTVEIFAGGIGIASTTRLLVLVTLLSAYLVAWGVLYKSSAKGSNPTPFGEHIYVSIAVTVICSAIIFWDAYYQLPSTIDAGFSNGPVFTMSKTLEL